jgi:hypothetical protein
MGSEAFEERSLDSERLSSAAAAEVVGASERRAERRMGLSISGPKRELFGVSGALFIAWMERPNTMSFGAPSTSMETMESRKKSMTASGPAAI